MLVKNNIFFNLSLRNPFPLAQTMQYVDHNFDSINSDILLIQSLANALQSVSNHLCAFVVSF